MYKIAKSKEVERIRISKIIAKSFDKSDFIIIRGILLSKT
jgi:hypothetical protein